MLLRLQNFYLLIITSIILAGCIVGPDFQPPESPQTNTYTEVALPTQTVTIQGAEAITQEFIATQKISGQWWHLFECLPLSQLIDRGLKNSPTLQAAQASLRQAQENLNAGMGGYLPSVDAQLSLTRERESEASLDLTGPPLMFSLLNVAVNVSYNPDIFGALHRKIEALDAQVNYQHFALEAAYLTLTSNIVTTAIREASLRSQIEVTKELITVQEKRLKIIKLQFPLGGVAKTDILAQEAVVAQIQGTLPSLESALAQNRHVLATLVGDLPSEAKLPSFKLEDFHLPTRLPVMIPSALVRSRPDIKAAEALLCQANANIGIAKADMFPQLVLTGSTGYLSNFTNTLFAGPSEVWNIGSQLLQPFFRGGTMMAKENAAIAAYEQTLGQYRQTILQAFQQVANVLTALVEDAKAHKSLKESERSTYKVLQLSQKQYQLGSISLFTLLNLENQYQQTKIALIKAIATRYADTAALFQALGGDYFLLRAPEKQEPNSEKREEED